jgi:hypothetical protein
MIQRVERTQEHLRHVAVSCGRTRIAPVATVLRARIATQIL